MNETNYPIKISMIIGSMHTKLEIEAGFTPERFALITELNYKFKDDAYYYFDKGIIWNHEDDKWDEWADVKYDPDSKKIIIDIESNQINEEQFRNTIGRKLSKEIKSFVHLAADNKECYD